MFKWTRIRKQVLDSWPPGWTMNPEKDGACGGYQVLKWDYGEFVFTDSLRWDDRWFPLPPPPPGA